VYFDNLQVVHTKGALLEETHYYPFGLAMPGISDKAAKPGYFENNYKFNDGAELQHHEFADGSGLELYATDFRSYDPQIGRFHQKDPFALLNPDFSSYSFVQNNPLIYNDPIGLDTFPVTGHLPGGTTPTMINVPNPTGGTSFYLYDPNNPNADQDGLIPQGIVEGMEQPYTITAKSKKGNKKATSSNSAGNNPNPVNTGNTGNAAGSTVGSGNLAARLMNSNRITFSHTHPNRQHPDDMANADDNIRDAATGGMVHTSEYGHARGVMVALDPRLLTMLEQLSREYTFNIIELAGARHSGNSRHYAGIAVDITEINGIPVTASNPFYRQMMRRARELGASEVLGPGNPDHDTHLHFGMPRR
jgi:RHS repeat-associated protein